MCFGAFVEIQLPGVTRAYFQSHYFIGTKMTIEQSGLFIGQANLMLLWLPWLWDVC